MKFDVIIAGGGIVGLATALQLQRSQPRLKIAVLEKEKQVAAHQSSRNSGVLHSGIYYRPDSLRASNCKRGYAQMLEFCRQEEIPFDVCGKIIVAAVPEERAQLDKIYQRGVENRLEGIRKISGEEAREIEPHVRAVEAVWVPQAGIVDYGQVAQRYADILKRDGAEVLLGHKVVGLEKRGATIHVTTEAQQFECKTFVNCGGLYSDKLALLSMPEDQLNVRILPFRGEYYELLPEAEHLVRNLIYPVPNPAFPFLGVHFTRMIGGGIEAGPNAVLAFRREGYHRSDIHLGELAETLAFSGFRKIAQRFWREGWAEMKRSYSKALFVKALQHLVPDIKPEHVTPGRAGVRAMACDRDGNMLDDFLILESPGIINVCNAPSPAATASLAIGETIAGLQSIVETPVSTT
ncbi:MAG: L-2-hydroxyglutarate oxidase [Saprospiraceae bacterium]|nr:L-2-hydroxyglutarate oxidase [Saprospiraceae bacterium]